MNFDLWCAPNSGVMTSAGQRVRRCLCTVDKTWCQRHMMQPPSQFSCIVIPKEEVFCHPPGYEVGGLKRSDSMVTDRVRFALLIDADIPTSVTRFVEKGFVFRRTGIKGYCRTFTCKHLETTKGT